MIILKIILTLLLTSVPFIHHYYILPKSKKDERYKHLGMVMKRYMPKINYYFFILKKRINKFFQELKTNETNRKFFLLIVFFTMLIFLYVDWQSSSKVANIYMEYKNKNMLSKLALVASNEYTFFDLKVLHNCLYSSVTFPLITLLSTLISFTFFSYKLSDKILIAIHNNITFFIINSIIIFLFSILYEGRMMLFSEIIFIINYAAILYPNREK